MTYSEKDIGLVGRHEALTSPTIRSDILKVNEDLLISIEPETNLDSLPVKFGSEVTVNDLRIFSDIPEAYIDLLLLIRTGG